MNDFPYDPDDPKLTAYALGELPEGPERAAVERMLAASPEARAAVEDIRAVTALLVAEYDQERAQAVGSAPETAAEDADGGDERGNIVAFPPMAQRRSAARRYAWLAMAAAVAVMATLGTLLVYVRIGMRGPGAGFAVTRGLQPNATSAKRAEPTEALRTTTVPAASASPAAALALNENAAAVAPRVDAPAPPEVSLATAVQPPASNLASASPAAGALADTAPGSASPPVTSKAVPAPMAQTTAQAPAAPASGTLFANSAPLADLPASARTRSSLPATSAPPELALRETTVKRQAVRRESSRREPSAPAPASVATSLRAGSPAAKPQPPTVGATAVASVSPRRQTFAKASAPVAVGSGTQAADSSQALSETDRAQDEFAMLSPPAGTPTPAPDFNTATYDHIAENPFRAARENPLSTFSIDVDTASYSNVRRFIEGGALPPKDAVRIEEMLNYFPYADAPPAGGSPHPFAIHLEAAACPWNPEHRLVRIGLKGREIARDHRPPSNLVFLIDVSGSMEPPERLPLIKESLRLLVEQLTENDQVAIVVYAGNSGLALPSTGGDHKDRILAALGKLAAGGSTNGAEGIQLAYKVAREHFIKGGVNRVILATDGDFNVGITSQGALIRLIEGEAKSGVFLSALGVGTDNYKDATMQKLADHGNGHYAYIDRLEEARKVLVEQMSGTLVTIAKDVKIQVEFNPAAVASYRLLGYEKRLLRKEDFNDDQVDAGEIGAGHGVTALYEVIPAGQTAVEPGRAVDPLKYQAPSPAPAAGAPAAEAGRADAGSPEMLTLKMRYKAPDADASVRAEEQALVDHPQPGDFARASADFKFEAAVAGFGLTLRDSPYKGNLTLGAVAELAQDGKGPDASGYRARFLDLVRRAQTLEGRGK